MSPSNTVLPTSGRSDLKGHRGKKKYTYLHIVHLTRISMHS
jgi:hypothetical protein